MTLSLKRKRTRMPFAGMPARVGVLIFLAFLTACGSGSGGHEYRVGGTVSGLEGSGLVLRNNDTDDLEITDDGAFRFATPLDEGEDFRVTVAAQPAGPLQTCTVNDGSGTVDGAAVSAVRVMCSTNSYSVGGTVSGLKGSGLVLRNNDGDDLEIAGDGAFGFDAPVADGADFRVTVAAQPVGPLQTCTVNGGSGTIDGAAVGAVRVVCATNSYSVGGTVGGLEGSGLVLQNNAGDDLVIGSDGDFSFAVPVASGADYDITVKTQPVGPSQTCTVNGGSGTVDGWEVTDAVVVCSTNSYTVNVTVSGLEGVGLVLQNNAGDDLAITADGDFSFAAPVASGAGYDITVKTQPVGPPMQSCGAAEPSGTVVDADVTVDVACGPAYILPDAAVAVTLGAKSALVDGTMLYVTTATEFKVLDVSDPLNPLPLGAVPHGYATYPPWRVEAQAIHNNVVWCVHTSSGGHGEGTAVFGVDVSDPQHPVLRGAMQLQAWSSLLSSVSLIHAGYWLVHDYSGNLIYVLDIGDPDDLKLHSSWPVPNMVNGGPGNMMIEGSLLYLPCGENGTLRIYDLENLIAVKEVGVVGLGAQMYGNAVKIGKYVYLSHSVMKVVDVSDPTDPVVVNTLSSAGYLKLRNGKLFAFHLDTPRVSVYSLQDPAAPVVEDFSNVPVPAPASSLTLYPLSYPAGTWVGDYLVGMTYTNHVDYNGARALYFPVD